MRERMLPGFLDHGTVEKVSMVSHAPPRESERILNWQPAGPNPFYYRDDLVDLPRAMGVWIPISRWPYIYLPRALGVFAGSCLNAACCRGLGSSGRGHHGRLNSTRVEYSMKCWAELFSTVVLATLFGSWVQVIAFDWKMCVVLSHANYWLNGLGK